MWSICGLNEELRQTGDHTTINNFHQERGCRYKNTNVPHEETSSATTHAAFRGHSAT